MVLLHQEGKLFLYTVTLTSKKMRRLKEWFYNKSTGLSWRGSRFTSHYLCVGTQSSAAVASVKLIPSSDI